MADHDPYVAPPAEPVPPGRLDALRPWLIAAIAVLVVAAFAVQGLVQGRQDPTLQFPGGASTPPPSAQPAEPVIPVLPTE